MIFDYLEFGNSNSTKAVVFVGGFGDFKNTYIPLIKLLVKKKNNYIFFTFSFSKNCTTLNLQSKYLQKFLDYVVKEKNINDITLVCTSDGAFSTSHLLINNILSKNIEKAVFIDPADYYLKQGKDNPWEFLWPGYKSYEPKFKTCSQLLKQIKSDAVIDVVNFTIQNYTKNGYVKPNLRSIDNPKLYPRLNNKMVKSFYVSTPSKNKGKYLELNNIPHAFMRDGNIKKNTAVLGDLLFDLI